VAPAVVPFSPRLAASSSDPELGCAGGVAAAFRASPSAPPPPSYARFIHDPDEGRNRSSVGADGVDGLFTVIEAAIWQGNDLRNYTAHIVAATIGYTVK
jgi:hypothetical protein